MLDPCRGLVTLLGSLREQLHDDRGDRVRHGRQPFGGRHRLSRDMAMHPLHGIRGDEGQRANEHLVKCDAECVEIAACIDRTVHAAGLLGGHVGEGAGDGLRRIRRPPLAGQTGGDAEPGEPYLPALVHQDVGRLEILVDETSLVDLAQRRDDADGKVQKATRFCWRAKQPFERLPSWVLEHQRNLTAVPDELQRSHRPPFVQVVPQAVFVSQASERDC